MPSWMNRRTLLKRSLQAAVAIPTAGVSYGFWEASQVRIDRREVTIPYLPSSFDGKVLAVLTDFHHGPWVSQGFIEQIVAKTNNLAPDLIALVGDFGHRGLHTKVDLPPCLESLSKLKAPLGVYAVPGNHDMQEQGRFYREMIKDTPLIDVTNKHESVSLHGDKLFLAGVDDLWWGKPDYESALKGIPEEQATLLLCHNPDYAEQKADERVGLMLSGHTHGGQVYLPLYGAPWLPSGYGEKYKHGLVQGPKCQVFVSRGLGEAGIPLRCLAPPEINFLTMRA
jgi:uncharacterized protein